MAEEQTAAKETEEAPAPEDTKGRAERGTEFIDFDALPDDIRGPLESRFNRVYGHMQENKRALQESARINKVLMEKVQAIETNTEKTKRESNLADVRARLVRAKEDGDTEAEVTLTEQMTRLATAPAPEPDAPPPPEPTGYDTHELSVMSVWAQEIDEQGNFTRPWVQDGNPRAAHAARVANMVFNSPEFASLPVEDRLAEVDRRMAPRKETQTVLDSGENRGGKSSGKDLTPAQKKVADAMGVSYDDYKKELM